jgi:site-specific recombinase XerD
MLRHFYATEMIKRGVNPEIVRRQMRHKNVSTTLRIYTQVRSEELENSLPTRPSDKLIATRLDSRKTLRLVK